MAADTVDLVCARLGIAAKSRTKRLPIGLTRPLDGLREETRALASRLDLDPAVATHLVNAHGDHAPAVLELALDDASLALPLVPGLPWLGAEAVWAVRREMASTLADVIERRTRLSLADRGAGLGSVAPLLVARELGWDGARLAEQIAGLRTAVTAERGPVAPVTAAAGTSDSAPIVRGS
jgi:glycerol-3-phosphate dehydrogenase